VPSDRATKTHVYRDFSGGEYGLLGRNAPPNSFTARNMLVYDDGSLGCRVGQKERSPASGLPSGVVMGFGTTGVPGAGVWAIVGSTVYGWDGTGAAFAFTTNLASTPTLPVASKLIGVETYITSYGDKSYKLAHSSGAGAVTALTGSPGGRTIDLYRDRLVVGGDNVVGYRLYFSAPADFTSWPVANYVDLGYYYPLSFVASQRQHLTVATQVDLWIVTGTLGVDETVRRIQGLNGPYTPDAAAISKDGQIFFVPLFTAEPATFDGALAKQVRYLETGSHLAQTSPPEFVVHAADDPGTIVMHHTTDGNAWVRRNGVWTQHTFAKTMRYAGWANRHGLLACDGGAVATVAKFYEWNFYANHPGSPTVDARTQPTDGSLTTAPVAYAYMPEHWAEAGKEVLVRKVTVDFTKWNTGMSQTNHFDLTVDALGRSGASSQALTSGSQSFDEAGSSSSTTGTRARKVFLIGDQGPAAGFQVKLDACRGVSIAEITVEYQFFDARPVS
jgi:hypothetical protein